MKNFLTTKEVAQVLRVSVRTLYNYASRHDIYKPSRPGTWHVEHVKILEDVWVNVLTEDEGLALWRYWLYCKRKGVEGHLANVGMSGMADAES